MSEIEVKVIGIDCNDLKDKVKSLGGTLVKKEFQENYIFSLPSELNSTGYIRIRVTKDYLHNNNKTLLCIKKVISQEKVRKMDEREFEVDNFDEAFGFLSALNIEFLSKENKSRESYKLNNSLIEFDKWDDEVFPYPYAEIESEDEEELNNIVSLLNIPTDKVTSKGLLQIKKEMGL
ncbi:class IV adenylate cyclase [Clostridium cylindrosporum]|uniref:Adenylate cyclase n=1 Tax=Clostridium cylindrosporum DSM 605 TaxID=1121307 RepID=A0A0J8D3W1_CLOCY|nr:class IV adenylate cyclase [Clostridium cylindrosporum]KMT20855.1 adenylate cyclase [Clostridium cylindrosporum DSM 605]